MKLLKCKSSFIGLGQFGATGDPKTTTLLGPART